MNNYTLQELYKEFVNDLFSAETQIAEALPNMIDVSSSGDLREELSHYLIEVKNHIEFLNRVFIELKEEPTGKKSIAIEGILDMAEQVVKHGGNSPVKDAGLIAHVQRLQHHKMATYGTVRTFARHLDYSKSMDLLQRALNNEGEADRKLTKIAEGGFFTTGINEVATKTKS